MRALEARRRRLRHQAVRPARAGRAAAGGAAARRRASPSEPAIASDGLEIDLAARIVRVDGEEVHLTPIEFDLLRVLARNRGRLMTHRDAARVEVWGPEYADDTSSLRTHIASLRAQDRARRAGRRATSSPTRASATASSTERRESQRPGPSRNRYGGPPFACAPSRGRVHDRRMDILAVALGIVGVRDPARPDRGDRPDMSARSSASSSAARTSSGCRLGARVRLPALRAAARGEALSMTFAGWLDDRRCSS